MRNWQRHRAETILHLRENTNTPLDDLGHGTHVAGSIGAMGDNAIGVTGINWNASLMDLKFLDASNQGLTSDAIRAVNYATMTPQTSLTSATPGIN